MDVGPDFYAAQTFYRSTLPDSRVIQVAWLGCWANRNGLNTAPWRHETTFPVELKLKNFPEGLRVTRIPIAEISSNYGETQHWNTETIVSDHNIFSETSSKCFDITTEFDLLNTTATQISFLIANKSFMYDISNSRIFDNMLNLENNRLKIRILADWGQIEVFVNEGQISYSEKFGVTPYESKISMTPNGDVNLVSALFCNVNRIWKNAPEANFVSNLTENWTALSGTWRYTSIGKQGCSIGGEAFIMNSQISSDFTYECDLRAMIGPADGIVFRANTDATEGYCVNIDANYAKGNSFVRLWELGRGELARSPQKILGGNVYHIKVVAIGSEIKVYFNNCESAIIEYTDLTPILSGKFGLFVCSGFFCEKTDEYPYPGYGVFNLKYGI